MTVRTTALGGTDWTDGEVLYSSDVNDTIETGVAGRLVRKDVMTQDTTEHTNTCAQGGSSSMEIYRFTPASSNNILLGLRVQTDSKYSTTNAEVHGYLQITVKNNVTNETINLGGPITYVNVDAGTLLSVVSSLTTDYASIDKTFILSDLPGSFDAVDITYGSSESNSLDGSSYDISLNILADHASGQTGTVTGYIDNTTITIYYADNVLTTTASAKFSQP